MIVPVTPKEVTRRYSDFSVRGALRATNELVAVWLGFSGFSDTDVNISLPLLNTGRHINPAIIDLALLRRNP